MKQEASKSTKKNYQPVATAKKHWIIYVVPSLIVMAGIVFLNNEQQFFKGAGLLLILSGFYYILKKANEKWLLTDQHLVIKKGIFPKKYQEVPVQDIYKTNTQTGKLSRFLNIATLNTRRRADNCSGLVNSNIANAEKFLNELQLIVQRHPSNNLNNVYALKESGAISEQEYNIIRLGYITQQHLS